jgi:RNA polymerase sigma factor (sigma-70 family)
MAASPSPEPTVCARDWLQSRGLVRIACAVARRMRLPAAEIDDLVQELRIRLWRTGPDASISAAWVFKTAEHRVIDFRRRQARLAALTPPPTRDPIDAELLGLLRARVSALPAELRQVCQLRLSGLSERDIARTLQVSRGRVRRINEWCERFLHGRGPGAGSRYHPRA